LHLGRCLTASVQRLIERSFIYAVMRTDGDDPGPRFAAIPLVSNCDIHALADDLKDDPAARLFGGMHDAFASIDAGGKLARRFPQRCQ
jgi:hypothetical protein